MARQHPSAATPAAGHPRLRRREGPGEWGAPGGSWEKERESRLGEGVKNNTWVPQPTYDKCGEISYRIKNLDDQDRIKNLDDQDKIFKRDARVQIVLDKRNKNSFTVIIWESTHPATYKAIFKKIYINLITFFHVSNKISNNTNK